MESRGCCRTPAHAAGQVFDWLGHLAAWVEKLLAIMCGMALSYAAILYLAGRGIARGSAPARIAGFTLSLLGLLVSLVLLLLLPRGAMAVPIFGCAFALYATWVLGWRYA